MKYLLGLDQGSTKTHAVLAQADGTLLAMGEAEGGCHTITGMEQAMGALRAAALSASVRAGVPLEAVSAIGGGITGIDYPHEQLLIEKTLRARFGVDAVYVHNDCIGALWGGTFEGPAVACCAGTGLNVGGVDASGRIVQLGNYCDGAHQGGGALGRMAIHAVCDAHIGKRPQTALTEAMLTHFDLPDVDALLLKDHRTRDIQHSRLSPLVFAVARHGDAVATGILRWTAIHYAEYSACVLRMLGLRETDRVPVIASGSVFKGRPPLMQQFMADTLAELWPGAYLLDARYEPVVGGAVMALREMGTGDWRTRVEESAQALGLVRLPQEA